MKYNDFYMLCEFLAKDKLIKKKQEEIQVIENEKDKLKSECSDSVVVCVKKHEYYMGKDKYSIDKNICLICGKEVTNLKGNSIIIDMSNYDFERSNITDSIAYKIFVLRNHYIDIMKNNPTISKEDLELELNKRIGNLKNKKVLEKTL